MRQKGFAILFVILIIVLIEIVGYLTYQNTQLKNSGVNFPSLIQKYNEIGQQIFRKANPTPASSPSSISTLILKIAFTDATVNCTESQLTDSMFSNTNSVSQAYSESSRGKLSFSGHVISVTVNLTKAQAATYCTVNQRPILTDIIDTETKNQGFDLSKYSLFVYVIPNRTCNWIGNADPDGKRVYNSRCEQPKIVAHEIGHYFGKIYHASTPTDEYGDYSDLMGGGGTAPLTQLNAPHLEQKGWLSGSAIQVITSSGTYQLDATELNTASNPQILKIYKPDTKDYHYISLRRPIGIDTNLMGYINPKTGDQYLNVVSIHEFQPDRSLLVGPQRTMLLDLISDNETYTDSVNNITIKNIGLTNNTATIEIQL